MSVNVEVWSFKKSFSRALIGEDGREHVHYLADILEEIKLPEEDSST